MNDLSNFTRLMKDLAAVIEHHRKNLGDNEISQGLLMLTVGFILRTFPDRELALQFMKDGFKDCVLEFSDLRSMFDDEPN